MVLLLSQPHPGHKDRCQPGLLQPAGKRASHLGALNTCSIGANSRSCQNNALLQFNKQHKINFFNWLANSPASGGTPLHAALDRAGRFLQTNGTAYTTEDGKTYSCRASYHIMMTDGIWNGRNVTPAISTTRTRPFLIAPSIGHSPLCRQQCQLIG